MAFDKLVDALNGFRKEYVKELNLSLAGGSSAGSEGQGQGHTASGKLGESLRLANQPKVKLFGQIYRMQISMEGYGIILDEGRDETKGGGSGDVYKGILQWLKYPNVVERLKDRFKGLKLGMSDDELSVFARPITNKIHRKGYKAKNWIKPATNKMMPKIGNIVETAIAEDIELTFEEIKKLIET